MKYVISAFLLMCFITFVFYALGDVMDDCKYSKEKKKSRGSTGIRANNMYYKVKWWLKIPLNFQGYFYDQDF